MSYTRKNENSQINECREEELKLLKELKNEKCQLTPDKFTFWNSTGGGKIARHLYSEDSCREASQEYVEQLSKCLDFIRKAR